MPASCLCSIEQNRHKIIPINQNDQDQVHDHEFDFNTFYFHLKLISRNRSSK